MSLKLIAADGVTAYELRPGTMQVVGRAVQCDVSIVDPTISRRHAELMPDDKGVVVRDLGSSNGTFINGAKITEQRAAAGDSITFGKLVFRLVVANPVTPPPPTASGAPHPGATIVRQLPVKSSTGELAAAMDRGSTPIASHPVQGAPTADKVQRKLAMLLEVSKGLSKAMTVDALLDKIASFALDVLGVDRTAILLLDDRGALVPKISRDKRGGDTTRTVPQSIARKAMDEKVAILSDDAGEDVRFGGQSILMQQVRSAMCAPLMRSDERVLGVLYVDSNSLTKRFADDDLEFLIAFAGVAATAIENSQLTESIRREAVVRSNFERFFTPHLAARIANAPDAVKLGGDKRIVTVLFSDIRGFTALSETMNPDDMARLLTEYFTEMVECVFEHGGTLDKFIGASISELSEVMACLPDPRAAANRIKRVLHAVFEATFNFDLENVRKKNLGPTVTWLEKLDGTTHFTVAYVVQAALAGHAIPMDAGSMGVLRVLDLMSDKDVHAGVVPGLERAVSKSKGIEFGSLLHELGADFSANPYSPNIREILCQIDPECEKRLPKRRADRPARKPHEPAAKDTEAVAGAAKRKAAGAAEKPAARKKPSAKEAATAPHPESPKKKAAVTEEPPAKAPAADQESASAGAAKKRPASEGLSKRKPR